ncbi:MAG TPA: hypothetical protein VJ476_14010 [Rhizomicrobium sp.]|nr:hypothetical protein [Rhizomicrobium sp.]
MYRNDLNLFSMQTLRAPSAGNHADEPDRAEPGAAGNSPATVLGELAVVLIVALSFAAVAQIVFGHAF